MLAPPEKPEAAPEKPATPPVKRRRIITLTNRAPISIIEDDWPIKAQGLYADNFNGADAPYGWEMAIRVREQDMKEKGPDGYRHSGMHIVHANYSSSAEDMDEDYIANQIVRVGRLLNWSEANDELYKHILEVGEELRTRINHEGRRAFVTHIVDRCFASLGPQMT